MAVETSGNVGPQSQSEPSGFVGFNEPTRMVPTPSTPIVEIPSSLQSFLPDPNGPAPEPQDNGDFDNEFEFGEASDSEDDFDKRDYDDDGQRLVDDSGQALIPFDPVQ
eukprot:4960041-Karenia_brevis.AAC.1